ncbi:cache domain-containing sensor histidine kinase [Halobacillus sp. H74]|uniref:cache domain-containing sensor histidine kinase n=1 Tax=Halobacillus sp. H74 TaxID=3457436 RepID=UPI003FCE1B2E
MFFSIRNRLIFIFTALITVPFIILSILVPEYFITVMKKEITASSKQSMDQYSLYLRTLASQAEDIGKQVLVSETTQTWLDIVTSKNASKQEKIVATNNIQGHVNQLMVNNGNNMSITLYLEDGSGIWKDVGPLKEKEWYQEFTDENKVWTNSHPDESRYSSQRVGSEMVNSYLLPLYDFYSLESYGVIKVNFPTSFLEQSLDKVKPGKGNEQTYIINDEGENMLGGPISTSNENIETIIEKMKDTSKDTGLIQLNFNGEGHYIFYENLGIGNMTLISEVMTDDLFGEVYTLRRNMLILSSVLFVLTIIASFSISSRIVTPLEQLTNAMRLVEKGRFKEAKCIIPNQSDYNHEVGFVIHVFNNTIDKLNHFIQKHYEANLLRKNAEYKALLLQINPHFLNNTLEVISSLAAQGRTEDVTKVSIYLSRMMAYSLNTKSNLVTINEELSYIKKYTSIMKLRYDNDLEVLIDENLNTSHVKIIKFTLQPLVENAIKYSMESAEKAKVIITTVLVGQCLEIHIEDNGPGMEQSLLEELRSHKPSTSEGLLSNSGNKIGLRNVLGRLSISFGERFSYKINSTEGEGTRISLYIDGVEEGEEDESSKHNDRR